VPSLNDVYIKSGQEADEFGAESLPNIKGDVMPAEQFDDYSGAFYDNGKEWAYSSYYTAGGNGLGFDASLSSPIYQDGAKVNPDHVKYRAYVVLYTGMDTNIDITKEIQLNNPFSFGMSQWLESDPKNASWLLSDGAFHSGAIYESFYNWLLSILNRETVEGVSVKESTDTYGDYDYVVNTTEATFRLPLNVLKASGNAVVGNGMTLGLTNGTDNFGLVTGGTAGDSSKTYYLVNSADGYGGQIGGKGATKSPSIDIWSGVTTDPTKSGIETSSNGLKLYFYVGETVQDANLINASKVLDLLAKLESYDYVVEYKAATAEDPRWYRVYKSGWVEQGGTMIANGQVRITTFLKPFKNTNYTLFCQNHEDSTYAWSNRFGYNKTITGFTWYSDNGIVSDWYACGQGA
jgi:hypothetical protein